MRTAVFLAVSLVAFMSMNVAHAQFTNLKALPGLSAKSTNKAGDSEQLVSTFVESYVHVISAQAKFAEAFDLQDELTLLQAEQQALASGQTDSDALKKVKQVSEDAQRAIAQKMEAQPELAESGRAAFSEGLGYYGKGLMAAKQTVDAAQGAGNPMAGNPLTMSAQAKVGVYVARVVPGYFSNLQKSTQMVFAYAGRNNIEPPADATALLAGL